MDFLKGLDNSYNTNNSNNTDISNQDSNHSNQQKYQKSVIKVINQQSNDKKKIKPFDSKVQQKALRKSISYTNDTSIPFTNKNKTKLPSKNIIQSQKQVQMSKQKIYLSQKKQKPQLVQHSLELKDDEWQTSEQELLYTQPTLGSNKILINYELNECITSSKEYNQIKASCHSMHRGLLKKEQLERCIEYGDVQCLQPELPRAYQHASFYGLYSGTGSTSCISYLLTHLHTNIINHPLFPTCPSQAISQAFSETDHLFLKQASPLQDNSGASVAVILVINETVYMATTGSVQAYLSLAQGNKKVQLNQPHHLYNPKEKQRVQSLGGQIEKTKEGRLFLNPGGLTVTRSFGCLFNKQEGRQLVIVSPQVKQFTIYSNYDYLLLTNSSLFSHLPLSQIQTLLSLPPPNPYLPLHSLAQHKCTSLIQHSLQNHALHNLSLLLLCFSNFIKPPKQQKSLQKYKQASQKLLTTISKATVESAGKYKHSYLLNKQKLNAKKSLTRKLFN